MKAYPEPCSITIAEALDCIVSRSYVLPAIQREFVWNEGQVCALFDSLMQGYSFGEFLFWLIQPSKSGDYQYYGFIADYHEAKRRHCEELPILHNKSLTAVLDGQQRLTAFLIGLRGSMAIKLPRKHWANEDAFPRRLLALDVLTEPKRDDASGNCYRFKFVREDGIGRQGEHFWYRVSDVSKKVEGSDWVLPDDIDSKQQSLARRLLDQLHRRVHQDRAIFYYPESSQEIEHVLNLFIRRNSGGTKLAYSDLLLSIAVSQWGDEKNARQEVNGLVQDLNAINGGLGLSKSFVLKAGLMLTDIGSVQFQVRNFTKKNMMRLLQDWDRIKAALFRTAELVTSFGFNSNSIRASNALLPIAYYLRKVDAPENFHRKGQYEEDRNAIRDWITRSILKKSNIWGSDSLIVALREVFRKEQGNRFPRDALETTMAQHGRSLTFTAEEIAFLADMEIGDRRLFAMLSLLFPFINVRDHRFHIDHVFPRSLFSPKLLREAGVEEAHIDDSIKCVNRLGNLQLIDGVVNNEKRTKLPAIWIREHFSDEERREHQTQHLLGELPEGLKDFLPFYNARRKRLCNKIAELTARH